MQLEREVYEQYQKAYAVASRSQQKNKKNSLLLCPVSLDSMLNERMISGRVDLGTMDIPTNLIVGVTEKSEQMTLFTKEFFPVSFPNSPAAEQWRQVYRRFLLEQVWPEQIVCVEYLGKFYVSDGLMQISVAKFADLPVISSHVIRILPVKADSEEVNAYLAFLRQYQLTRLYQLQFTQQGFFEEFQSALGKHPADMWTDKDRNTFLPFWQGIEHALAKSYADSISITAADALVILLRKYTYQQLLRMDPWVIARLFQASWKELYALGSQNADTDTTPAKKLSLSLQTA